MPLLEKKKKSQAQTLLAKHTPLPFVIYAQNLIAPREIDTCVHWGCSGSTQHISFKQFNPEVKHAWRATTIYLQFDATGCCQSPTFFLHPPSSLQDLWFCVCLSGAIFFSLKNVLEN
jgi:hypothetical protein